MFLATFLFAVLLNKKPSKKNYDIPWLSFGAASLFSSRQPLALRWLCFLVAAFAIRTLVSPVSPSLPRRLRDPPERPKPHTIPLACSR